ncbi:MAG: acyltransferase family protein [Pseudonocardiales bacterium]
MSTTTSGTDKAGKSAFVDIARGVAALLIVYLHVGVVWLREGHGVSTPVTTVITAVISQPLQLGVQDVGQLAVPMFFLVSGFIMTPIAMRRGGARFAVNRFFRLVPLLVVAVLVAAAALAFGLRPLSSGDPGAVTPAVILANITLVNYLAEPHSALLGVTWSLLVEAIFYSLLLLALPLLRRAPWLAIAGELMVIAVVLLLHNQFGTGYRLFAAYTALATIPLIGQIVWAARSRRIPPWLAGLYGLLAWLLLVWSISVKAGRFDDDGYLAAVAFTILLFLMGLLAEPYLTRRWIWTFLSERLYSIYLVHGIAAFLVLDAVYGLVPGWLAVLTALATTLVAVEVAYRLVERPTHLLGRRLGRPRRGPAFDHGYSEVPSRGVSVSSEVSAASGR